MRSTWWCTGVLLLALRVSSCGAASPAESVAADTDGQEYGGRLDVPCRESPGARPPLRPDDIKAVSTGSFDAVSDAFVDADGTFIVVYEAFGDAEMNVARLETVTSRDCGRTFTPPKQIDFGSTTLYRATPSAVTIGEHRYLYFVSANSFSAPVTILRSRFEAGGFREPEPVEPLGGADALLSWPRFIEGPEGVAAAYRTSTGRKASLALSADGRAFGAPAVVHEGVNAMVRNAFFGNGAMVATYQNGSAENALSWWRIWSRRNPKWTEPVLVSSRENVHDTIPFLRSDGEIDLYYVHSTLELTDTFKLYRRSLTREGVLGPEELVTDLGSPSKPNLARLPGGKVLLMYADITQVDEIGYPRVQIIKTAVLAEDAPRP